ncbi:MAG TPA: NAD(P)H-hydrate dehydratase [Gaiellaceae bacterium]|jgi:NAD(P)H-hydrate epimerase|nr:NAD(P)H-hydrate dehydratase [Gaiellaceae bacterium]
MLEPLYTADEMRAAEAGHDVEAMMERAGRGVAEAVLRRFPEARRVACVCGRGANGGDGRIAARVLREAGRDAVEELGEGADVVVDALFGTGFRGEPRADAAELIRRMNGAGAPVVAVDVPSGVNASTGEVAGAAVRAAVTVTMHAPKVGLVVAPGRFHAGEVDVVEIGLERAETEHRLVTGDVLARVPRRREGDNKYSAGAVLVVGGAPGLTGAACLAAEAAFRADAGYVAVAVPERSLPVVEQRLLEAVKRPIDEVDELLPRMDALALGPGLGRGEEQRALVRRLLSESSLPAVVDADGLHELQPFTRDAPTVLTPHEGELARLLGEESRWVATHRLEAIRRGVERFGCVVLLKGADTLVGAPGAGVLVRSANAPGLATAGTGDVLTGIVAAFLAKGLEAQLAAAAGAVAQARAARLAPQQAGLVASDVVALLPRALA